MINHAAIANRLFNLLFITPIYCSPLNTPLPIARNKRFSIIIICRVYLFKRCEDCFPTFQVYPKRRGLKRFRLFSHLLSSPASDTVLGSRGDVRRHEGALSRFARILPACYILDRVCGARLTPLASLSILMQLHKFGVTEE